MYSLLNNAGVIDAGPCTVDNSSITYDSPKTSVVSQYPQGIGSKTPAPYQNPQMLESFIWNGVEKCIQLAFHI